LEKILGVIAPPPVVSVGVSNLEREKKRSEQKEEKSIAFLVQHK
jgi:hypothetical protein